MPPHIIIGTPHALDTALVVKNLFNLSVLKFVIADEIDHLMHGYSRPALESIIQKCIIRQGKKRGNRSLASLETGGASDGSLYSGAKSGTSGLSGHPKKPDALSESHSGGFLSSTKPGFVTARLVFVSATITADVKRFAREVMFRPQHILPSTTDPLALSSPIPVNPFTTTKSVAAASGDADGDGDSGAAHENDSPVRDDRITVPNSVPHYVLTAASNRGKINLLSKLWSAIQPTPRAVLVFVNDARLAKPICELLQAKNFGVGALLNSSSKTDRNKLLRGIVSGRYQFIIGTDSMARGLDIKGLTHVVQYDMPTEPNAYLHRSGRVGRTGHSIPFERCAVVTLCTVADHKRLMNFQTELNISIQPVSIDHGRFVASDWGVQRAPKPDEPATEPQPQPIATADSPHAQPDGTDSTTGTTDTATNTYTATSSLNSKSATGTGTGSGSADSAVPSDSAASASDTTPQQIDSVARPDSASNSQ